MTRIVLIFLCFAIVHSITVAQWFKRLCARVFGEAFLRIWYRFLYTLVSAVTAGAAVWLIGQVPDTHLWTAPPVLRWPLHGFQAAGLLFGALAFQHLDGMEFLGLRQVWRYLARSEAAGNLEGMTDRGLVTEGVYGMVRHPIYVAGIVIFTCNPVITVNGLTITALADLYFFFGMVIEERRFLRFFGDDYRRYMQRVPRMIPRLGRGKISFWLQALAGSAFLALVVFALMRSCGRDTIGTVGPQGAGRTISQDRPQLAQEIARLFPEWVRAMRTADPGFEVEVMRLETIEPIDAPATGSAPISPAAGSEGLHRLLSPDASRYLLLAAGATSEPDTGLSVIDIPKREQRSVFFYGPATHIDGVKWLDNSTLAAVGTDALPDASYGPDAGPQPVVWIILLGEDRIKTYAAAPLPE